MNSVELCACTQNICVCCVSFYFLVTFSHGYDIWQHVTRYKDLVTLIIDNVLLLSESSLILYSHPVYNLYSSSSISTAQSVLWHHSVVVVVVHRRTDSTTLRCLSVSSLSCSAAANIRASRAGPNLDSAQDNACHLYIIILIKVNRAKSKSSIFVVDWLRIRGEQ